MLNVKLYKKQFKGTGYKLHIESNEYNEINFQQIENNIYNAIKTGIDFIVLFDKNVSNRKISTEEKRTIIHKTLQICSENIPLLVNIDINDEYIDLDSVYKLDIYNTNGYIININSTITREPTDLKKIITAVCNITNKPIFIANTCKSLPNINLLKEINQLQEENFNIVGLIFDGKYVEYITEAIKCLPYDFILLNDNDKTILPSLACGANGIISSKVSTHANEIINIVNLVMVGKLEKARKIMLEISEDIN